MVFQPQEQLSSVTGLSKSRIKGIMAKALDPLHCTDVRLIEDPICVDLFKRTYLYQMVFDKYCTLDPASAGQRREACTKKYLECESRCNVWNEFFYSGRYRKHRNYDIILNARRIITRILGDFESEDLFSDTSFGPGASTRLKYAYGNASFKFEGSPHVTPQLGELIGGYFDLYPGIGKFESVKCAKYTTVPKNSVIDRPIEIQPEMNIFFQKAIGSFIRKRMKGLQTGYGSLRIDLNDQTVNRELCRLGSIDGSLATIDLSSASDLISCGLVASLIEDSRLFWAMYVTRVGHVSLDGNTLALNKFSAMGNGFTWELQSLLFYALTKALCEHIGIEDPVVATFGDDIIVNAQAAPYLMNFLEWCGLRVNHTKSYYKGYFRESCGRHYYRGYDVSPVYLREPLSGPVECMRFHNRLIEWCARDGYLPTYMRTVVTLLRLHADERTCPYVPFGTGDCGFYTCASENLVVLRYSNKRGNMLFKARVGMRPILTWPSIGSYVKSLHTFCATSACDIPFGKERFQIRFGRIEVCPYLGGWR